MIPTVFLVYPQDKLFAYVAREIQVNVGNAGQGVFRQEPLQGEVVLQGIDVRQAYQVAHQHGHAGTPATARRRLFNGHLRVHQPQFHLHLAGHAYDFVVQQEEPRQAVLADETELLLQPALHLGGDGPIATYSRLATQFLQVAVRSVPGRYGVVGEAVV